MTFKVKFKETEPMKVNFGEVQVVDTYDVGFSDGFSEGEEVGHKVGYTDGHNDGYAQGVSDGFVDGYEDGCIDGYIEGETEGYLLGYDDGYSIGHSDGSESGYAEGHSKGKEEGLSEGYQNGYSVGIEKGKQAEHSDFWDAFQCNGQRRNYYRAFCNANNVAESLGWNENTFRPKYDIKATSMPQGFSNLDVNDLDSLLKECGVVLDTSACTNLQQAFSGSKITIFPALHLKGATNVESVFSNCKKLHTIRKIVFELDINATLPGIFTGCSALANIDEVEGSIEHNISFSASPLTVETMKRIISHLKDYKGTDSEGTYKVTFLSWDDLEASGTSPNGDTWKNYVHSLGWTY